MFTIHSRIATPDEYRALCTAVGWEQVMNFEAAVDALPRSLFGVVATDDEQVIGMGRIVGDGAIFFYLQDIAVRPEYHNRGVGTLIVDALMTWIRDNAPPKAFVGLFSASRAATLYRRYGFNDHEVLLGMFTTTPLREGRIT